MNCKYFVIALMLFFTALSYGQEMADFRDLVSQCRKIVRHYDKIKELNDSIRSNDKEIRRKRSEWATTCKKYIHDTPPAEKTMEELEYLINRTDSIEEKHIYTALVRERQKLDKDDKAPDMDSEEDKIPMRKDNDKDSKRGNSRNFNDEFPPKDKENLEGDIFSKK